MAQSCDELGDLIDSLGVPNQNVSLLLDVVLNSKNKKDYWYDRYLLLVKCQSCLSKGKAYRCNKCSFPLLQSIGELSKLNKLKSAVISIEKKRHDEIQAQIALEIEQKIEKELQEEYKKQKIEKENNLKSQELIDSFIKMDLSSSNANIYLKKVIVDLDAEETLFRNKIHLEEYILVLEEILNEDFADNRNSSNYIYLVFQCSLVSLIIFILLNGVSNPSYLLRQLSYLMTSFISYLLIVVFIVLRFLDGKLRHKKQLEIDQDLELIREFTNKLNQA